MSVNNAAKISFASALLNILVAHARSHRRVRRAVAADLRVDYILTVVNLPLAQHQAR